MANLRSIFEAAKNALTAGDAAAAEAALAPALDQSERNVDAAELVAHALTLDGWPLERRLTLGNALTAAWPDEPRVMSHLAHEFECFVDMRLLNEAPPTHPVAQRLLQFAARRFETATEAQRLDAANMLFSVARLSGRAADALAERAARTAIELEPGSSSAWYRLGLFFKTRGRFEAGVLANQRAMELSDKPSEAAIWNLGICATGARQGQLAMDLWKRELGAKLELGSDGLPTGGWPEVKVRLSERPVAMRDAHHDSPGAEETVWVDRLSPCHGRVLNLTFEDLGVDFGDLVLFDGAAIARQEINGRPVFVFPHLATLQRGTARIFRFVAQLPEGKDADAVAQQLPEGIEFYSHTDSLIVLCRECALRDGPVKDCSHETRRPSRVVRGKLAIGERHGLREADTLLQKALAGGWLAAPALADALGDSRRAAKEQARFADAPEV